MKNEKIALINFGRSHWLKLPQLGLVILTNKINSLNGYSCEIFDYGEIPMYSFAGDHLSVMHYNANQDKYPSGFIPELPILDLLLRSIKNVKNSEDLNLEFLNNMILGNKNKLNFILDFCKRIGHNPHLFIEMIKRIFRILPKVINELRDFKFVGFFNHTANFFGTLLLSETLRHIGKRTFGGGPQITTFFEQMKECLKNNLFYDYIVKGDAEDYIEHILDELKNNKSNQFDCSVGKDLKKVEKLDLEYNFDCVLNKRYLYHHLIFDFSRGCPARCNFCGEYKIHGRTCLKDPKKAAEHLVNLTLRYEKHPEFIPLWRIGDSLINFDNGFLNMFLDKLIELKKVSRSLYVKGLSFYGYARGDISREMADKLWKAGCRQLWIGVESFDDNFLKLYNKELDIKTITDSIINLLKNRMSTGLLLITPSDAIIDCSNYSVFNEIQGIFKFVNKVINKVEFLRIKSGPFPYDQKVFIAAHTMLTIMGNSSYHEKFPIQNWKKEDFFNSKVNPYSNLPKYYQLKDNLDQSIRDYYHKDQILRKLFPINKDSTLERIDETLEFSTIGSQCRSLRLFDHTILNTPDYFSLKKPLKKEGNSIDVIRDYLINKAWE